MNQNCKLIMEQYRESRPDFVKLGDVVSHLLRKIVNDNSIEVMAIEHRVKAEKSLAGKLELKGDRYSSLEDITDILGTRIICYFSDDVDRVASHIENTFCIDRENSVDKRAMLDPDRFGYLSLHFICFLEDNGSYPAEICNKKFEIQIRSILQHTWAAINHDLGYKSDFGIPKNITREFSRVAGLLEIADEEFINIRNSVKFYGEDIRRKIACNEADDVLLDLVSLKAYMQCNIKMRSFIGSIANICNAEISEVSSESYLEQLIWLGKKTIGDIDKMLDANSELAFSLAKQSLQNSELDILASNIGLRYLCRAELLNRRYSVDEIMEFICISTANKKRAKAQAERLVKTYETLLG